ncbi:MAG: cupredoxin domain-containing protein [Chloroflexota bacterium]|nr:cupredoxin domain-containing protein [Dehalococcoidia bacterium]MDW8254234.1 cupredoxin domain-containing protein [Chloroflexota bacterium]
MRVVSRNVRRGMIGVVAGAALLLAACTGGGGGGGGTTISAKRGGFAFEPSTITVPVNQPVTITFRNPDSQAHDWRVRGTGLPEEPVLYADPGKQETKTFVFPTAGEFQTYCSLPGHEAAGMVGKLIVR